MGKRPKKIRRKRKCEWPIKTRRGSASSAGKGTDMEVDAAGRRRVTDIGSAKYSTRVSSAGENVGRRAVRRRRGPRTRGLGPRSESLRLPETPKLPVRSELSRDSLAHGPRRAECSWQRLPK